MDSLDPREHAVRPDLADARFEGRVAAARFVEGRPAVVRRGVADLKRAPSHDAPLDSQLLFGEAVQCFDVAEGWAWVQSDVDGYVGYLRDDALRTAAGETPDHRVVVLATHLYPEPDLKAPALDIVTFGAHARVTGQQGAFSQVASGQAGDGWLVTSHLRPLDDLAPDHVETALAFRGLPYLWGGRSALGLDCSALVQLALDRAGIHCRRDSDQQAASVGEAVPRGDLRRGDLVYMPGHVVIALDATDVVNANAHHMMVSVEPLADVLGRVAEETGRSPEDCVTAVRRP